jgi:exodeoxyribonuclease VII small subunit
VTGRPRKERTFEDAMTRLEAIVAELEGEDRGLEEQFALFQEGMELARFCDQKLGEVEKSVEIVLKEAAGEWKTAPFDPGRPADEGDDDRG